MKTYAICCAIHAWRRCVSARGGSVSSRRSISTVRRMLRCGCCIRLGRTGSPRGGPRGRADPAVLAACVRLALAHNPAVQDAVDATLSAVLGRDVPLADYHFKAVPSVSGGLQGDNNTNQRYDLELSRKLMLTGTQIGLTGGTSVFSSVPQSSVPYLTETRVTLTQPLWQGRSRLENGERLDDADRRIGAPKHTLAGAGGDLGLEGARGFYDVLRAGQLGDAAGSSLHRESPLDQARRCKLP